MKRLQRFVSIRSDGLTLFERMKNLFFTHKSKLFTAFLNRSNINTNPAHKTEHVMYMYLRMWCHSAQWKHIIHSSSDQHNIDEREILENVLFIAKNLHRMRVKWIKRYFHQYLNDFVLLLCHFYVLFYFSSLGICGN